jgi:hypothetical protein
VAELREGGSLDYGSTEMWTVAISTTISLAGLALAIYLVVRSDRARA